MRNTIGDLNNYLFEQLERITDDSLSYGELEETLRRLDGVIKISEKIIENGELAYKTMKLMIENGEDVAVPRMLLTDGK